ncbi:hypothetical protein DL93DRAFT_2089449 [Clavulina sp. PMI_390]|nr:hypothetical protein DL93DRAFT_2089449 [Clavulina sp. PMI_390]
MRVLVRFTLHRPHQYASVLARHLSDGSKRTPPSPQPVVKRPLTELQTLTKALTKLISLRVR